MASAPDERNLTDTLDPPSDPPSLADFLLWAGAVGCFPVQDAYGRFTRYIESRRNP